jgi:SAM-dependent methyltransferase
VGAIVRTLKPVARACLAPGRRLFYYGRARACPICRGRVRRFLPFGVVPRPDARCPICGSLERHRMARRFLERRTDLFDPRPKRMLHIAPEPVLEALFRRRPQIDYLSADLLDPRAMVRMDITDIQYPDGSFDVIFCSHVLEHVPDDRRAMREIRRVLKRGGWSAIQVPVAAGPTREDPSITDPAERERLFGQSDHVRSYGSDFKDRLEGAGFQVRVVRAADLMEPEERVHLGVPVEEAIHHCT